MSGEIVESGINFDPIRALVIMSPKVQKVWRKFERGLKGARVRCAVATRVPKGTTCEYTDVILIPVAYVSHNLSNAAVALARKAGVPFILSTSRSPTRMVRELQERFPERVTWVPTGGRPSSLSPADVLEIMEAGSDHPNWDKARRAVRRGGFQIETELARKAVVWAVRLKAPRLMPALVECRRHLTRDGYALPTKPQPEPVEPPPLPPKPQPVEPQPEPQPEPVEPQPEPVEPQPEPQPEPEPDDQVWEQLVGEAEGEIDQLRAQLREVQAKANREIDRAKAEAAEAKTKADREISRLREQLAQTREQLANARDAALITMSTRETMRAGQAKALGWKLHALMHGCDDHDDEIAMAAAERLWRAGKEAA